MVRVMEGMQVEQKDDWQARYRTPEQRQTMAKIGAAAYVDVTRQQRATHGEWSEADQERVNAQYAALAADLKRIVAVGADPASPEAQDIAQRQWALVDAFTQRDSAIEAGLCQAGEIYATLPESRKPPMMPGSQEEGNFMQEALAIYEARQQEAWHFRQKGRALYEARRRMKKGQVGSRREDTSTPTTHDPERGLSRLCSWH